MRTETTKQETTVAWLQVLSQDAEKPRLAAGHTQAHVPSSWWHGPAAAAGGTLRRKSPDVDEEEAKAHRRKSRRVDDDWREAAPSPSSVAPSSEDDAPSPCSVAISDDSAPSLSAASESTTECDDDDTSAPSSDTEDNEVALRITLRTTEAPPYGVPEAGAASAGLGLDARQHCCAQLDAARAELAAAHKRWTSERAALHAAIDVADARAARSQAIAEKLHSQLEGTLRAIDQERTAARFANSSLFGRIESLERQLRAARGEGPVIRSYG